ncbi:unnamed protein product [Brugia pahangi]|uniref:Uncharacterized protein n=1 Tax=Brugia pahangi TaxID=6280 RepID=A0A0N4TEV0_BRUPA|nr:unnamed protein product [Brugia pahangi]
MTRKDLILKGIRQNGISTIKNRNNLRKSVCKVKKYNFFSNISNPVAVPPQYPFGHENRNREYAGRIQNQYDKFGYKQLNGNKLKIKRTNSHMQMGKCPSKNSANMVTKYQRNEYREDGPSTNKNLLCTETPQP